MRPPRRVLGRNFAPDYFDIGNLRRFLTKEISTRIYGLQEVPFYLQRFTPFFFQKTAAEEGLTLVSMETSVSELEVLSMIWGHMCRIEKRKDYFRAAVCLLARVAVNCIAAVF